MKLTPLDVRKQEFKKVMRGYDPDEVEAFLVMLADELEVHIRDKNQLNDELIKLRTQLRDYQRVESTLRDTLVKAQNTVEDSRVNSRREAEIIIHEAELQAENIIKEAREELMNIRHEISLLRAQKEAIAKRLRHMLESQIEMLEVMEIEDFKHLESKRSETNERYTQLRPQTPGETPTRRDSVSNRYADEEKPRIVRPDTRGSGLNLSRDMRDVPEQKPPSPKTDLT
ncbi:MAG: DivIVA domain-containing protein [Calditrichaeota bacterium]|nr:MAG: DivIVA domain-containing protein [Calditrichota bacterium]